MEKNTAIKIIGEYFKSVSQAYALGNIESSYNAPIITLFNQFGCVARDMSGERSGHSGENIDIKLWHTNDEVGDIEPFAGIEVKKICGIDDRARSQIEIETARYGNAILTDNLVWRFYRAEDDNKMYSGVQLIELRDGMLYLRKDNIDLFTSLIEDFLLQDPTQIKSSNKLAQ